MTAVAESAVMPPASQPRRGKSKAAGDQGAAPPVVLSAAPAVQLVPLAQLRDNPANPREQLGDVTELAASIRSIGLLEDLVVAPWYLHERANGDPDAVDDGTFVVIAGHRRKAACELAPLDPVPCKLRPDLAGSRGEEAMLIENLHREDLTALEEARGYQRLIEIHKLSQRDLADRVGRNQSHISKRLSLLKLPAIAQQAVIAGKLTIDEGRALLPIADDEGRLRDVIEARHGWQTVEQAVARHVDEIDRSTKVAELITQIRKDGGRYTKTVPYDGIVSHLPVAARKGHESLPCHAFTIPSYGQPEIVPACTDPRSHLPGGAGAPDAKKAAAAARKQEKAEALAREQRDQRLAVVQALLTARSTKAIEEYGVARAVATAIENYWSPSGTDSSLLGLLGLTCAEGQDFDEVLEVYAAKGHAFRLRLLAAFEIDDTEGAWKHLSNADREAYEQLLMAGGWTKPAGTS